MHKYKNLIEYIDSGWEELIVTTKEDDSTHLGLPNSFVAPSVHRVDDFVFRDQFYWDTYFTVISLIGTERHSLGKGMVDNLLYQIERFGYVPNSNNLVHQGRSQPPLLSSMVSLVFANDKDHGWLKKAYGLIKQEYWNVWLSADHPHDRNVHKDLSRYYHEDQTNRGAEDESGWDYTTRFNGHVLGYLPIDLNSFLYKYETDLASFADVLNMPNEAKEWASRAESRKGVINELMWDEELGMFFDYNFVEQCRHDIWSLAGFVPLFVGLTSDEQASKLRENLDVFETEFGLSTTPKDHPPTPSKQWSAPNGWAPLHYMVVEGLKRYGHHTDAKRIAGKWIDLVDSGFKNTGLVFEKYNVVHPDQPPTSAVYPDQYGFAWTNSVTALFIEEYL